MPAADASERFQLELTTPEGPLRAHVEVPSGFVPLTAIVPLMQRLSREVLEREEVQAQAAGTTVSCQKGCAACCRMLVPVSAPEALRLKKVVDGLPEAQRVRIRARMLQAQQQLEAAGLLERLQEVLVDDRQRSDEDMEPLNRDYYALRLPCPFLENELCSVYEERPAACRELLVTSPAELCRQLDTNPVQPLPVSLRASTALALLWAELHGEPVRLIPLPLALEWAESHAAGAEFRSGPDLLERSLNHAAHLLQLAFDERSGTSLPR